MKTAGVAEIKARLSEYLAAVEAGEEVLVTKRGVPVARLAPLSPETAPNAHLERLEKAGLLRRPTRKLDASFWKLPRPKDPEGAVLKALLAEREEGW
jgi:prevent-host-death family protein